MINLSEKNTALLFLAGGMALAGLGGYTIHQREEDSALYLKRVEELAQIESSLAEEIVKPKVNEGYFNELELNLREIKSLSSSPTNFSAINSSLETHFYNRIDELITEANFSKNHLYESPSNLKKNLLFIRDGILDLKKQEQELADNGYGGSNALASLAFIFSALFLTAGGVGYYLNRK